MFARGYLPGGTLNECVLVLAVPGREAALQGLPDKVNAFLGEAADAVRPLFGGRVSYAPCPLDEVDRAPFDIVGLDAFRSLRNAAAYRAGLRKECGHGKPVAIMEAGGVTLGPGLVRIVKVLDEHNNYPADKRAYPGMPWEPKQAFHALATRGRRGRSAWAAR
ncbi:hypothetical protein [Streptomyces rimosus]|uniref:hypothetical protein n=1 Tax=Streptomyces rimosus TaxID=1927 RepID=UPI00131DEA2A